MSILEEMLRDAAGYDAEYATRLSNHLPMALIALSRMGADDAALTRFRDGYATRLVPRGKPRERLSRASLASRVGKHEAHAELAELFDAEWGSMGRDALLGRYLPMLMEGVGGAAFHGLIRLSYGIDAGSRSEIVEGLAHWADSHLPLARQRPPQLPLALSPTASLARLAADQELRASTGPRVTIFDDMALVAAEPAFARHAWGLGLSESLVPQALAEMADLSLRLYASTRNFTALHLVTSVHAMRLVLPFLTDRAPALQHYWNAALAAYVTVGKPEPRPIKERTSVPAWSEILASACASRDEHTVKLVYTCTAEAAFHQALPYQAVAAERVNL